MRTKTLLTRSGRVLLSFLLILSAASVGAGADGASSQEEKGTTKANTRDGATVEVWKYNYIPAASQPCTKEETEWWRQTRAAGNGIFLAWKGHDAKSISESRARFLVLLSEGRQKGYRVPLDDRPSQFLLHARPVYPYIAEKEKIGGTVWVSLDVTADGTAGDVRVIDGLGWGLDQSAIQAVKQWVFLPAIKDGAFVAERKKVGIIFCRRLSEC